MKKTELFSVYSPKLICNVHGLEDILQDRSISIITQQAPADSSIRGSQPDMDDPRWQEIRDRLYLALMFYHGEVRQHRDADDSGELAQLREKELFKPLIDLAMWVSAHGDCSEAMEAIISALATQKDARQFNRDLTPEAQLTNALRNLLDSRDEIEAHSGQIKDAIATQSTDAPDWCSDIWIGRTLRKQSIWRDNRDESRRRVFVEEDGVRKEKILKHYLIRRDRLKG